MPQRFHQAVTQQLGIKQLLFTSDVLDNGKLQHTKQHLPHLTFSPSTLSTFNKDAFSLNEPFQHSQIWPLHSRLWNVQFAKEQKTPFCSLKYSLEFCEEKLTSGALHKTRHDLPGQPSHWWRHVPPRQFSIHLTSLGIPLQPQSLTFPVLSLTSALLSLVPIDKNVFFVSSIHSRVLFGGEEQPHR